MANPTYFTDDIARNLRQAEVPLASFINGCNFAASNAVGLGINVEGGAVVGTPEQFTLEDQNELSRISQRSQFVGGYPYTDPADYPSSGGTPGTEPDGVIFTGDLPTNAEKEALPSLDGVVNKLGQVSLTDLADGWEIDAS